MQRTMNLKGFFLIVGILLVVFLVLNGVLGNHGSEKDNARKALQMRLSKLEEENKELMRQLNSAGSAEEIAARAVKEYSYVKPDAIRFEFTNPEMLYAYSEEELNMLMDELID